MLAFPSPPQQWGRAKGEGVHPLVASPIFEFNRRRCALRATFCETCRAERPPHPTLSPIVVGERGKRGALRTISARSNHHVTSSIAGSSRWLTLRPPWPT